MGSAATLIITARLLKLMSFMLISPSTSNSSVTAACRAPRNGNEKRKDWERRNNYVIAVPGQNSPV
jgi:hypothetical protein